MSRKVTYIPTLKEYMRKIKKQNVEMTSSRNCSDCQYYRSEFDVCICGENVRSVANLRSCPVAYKVR